MTCNLPTSLEIGGKRYKIRTDYRAVLDIITALSDNELTDSDKVSVMLTIFYEDGIPDDTQEAITQCFAFINRFQPDEPSNTPKLMDWEKDFNFIADAIAVKTGKEIREIDYLHWWSFVGFYMNIGDCFFAQIVSIRKKLKKGQKLDAADKEFYRSNKKIVDLSEKLTAEDEEILSEWLGGGAHGS